MENSQGSTLYAEWRGEFGHLLLNYLPAVRHLARSFDRIVVAADASTEYLWEFATDFIKLKCEGHALHTGKILRGVLPKIEDDWFDARWGHGLFTKGWRKDPPVREHRKLGAGSSIAPCIMYAFRPPKSPKGHNPMRKAYPREMCRKLTDLLMETGLAVICYGGPDNWYFGGHDGRGESLALQCARLSVAKVAIGPSSGTMHLASLCGCPHVTWCDHASIRRRYEVNWNPFGTPVRYLPGVPEPEEVVEAAKEIMR